MPSGWQLFPVNICPVHCHPFNRFLHLCRPTSHLFLSHISYSAVSIHVAPYLCHHARSTLSSPLTLSAILIILHLYRASIVVLPRHYLPSFRVLCHFCFSTFSDWILSSLCVVLCYTSCSALLHTTFLNIRSDLLTTLYFSVLARLISLSVMFLIRSDLPRFFSTCFHSAPI